MSRIFTNLILDEHWIVSETKTAIVTFGTTAFFRNRGGFFRIKEFSGLNPSGRNYLQIELPNSFSNCSTKE